MRKAKMCDTRKEPFVGDGAHDVPFGNVANSPKVERNRRCLPPGRRGRRPLQFEFHRKRFVDRLKTDEPKLVRSFYSQRCSTRSLISWVLPWFQYWVPI